MQLYTDKFHASTLFNLIQIRTHAMKLKPVKGTVNVILCDPSYIKWVIRQRCPSSENKVIKIFGSFFAEELKKETDEIKHFKR